MHKNEFKEKMGEKTLNRFIVFMGCELIKEYISLKCGWSCSNKHFFLFILKINAYDRKKCHSSDLLHVSANNLSRIEEYENKRKRDKKKIVSCLRNSWKISRID